MVQDYDNEYQDNYILPPDVDEDDVNQEAELLKLLGKTPNKAIIRSRLNYRNRREYLFFDEATGKVIPAFQYHQVSSETYDYLVNWALNQTQNIANLIFSFLENPSEASLKDLLGKLKKAGLIEEAKAPKPSSNNSLTQLVLRHLTVAQPIEELYELARRSVNTQRPEASVRQLLRRLCRAGTVLNLGDNIYIKA